MKRQHWILAAVMVVCTVAIIATVLLVNAANARQDCIDRTDDFYLQEILCD